MELTITELLAGSGVTVGTIATAVITAYNKLNTKINKMETKIEFLEAEIKEEKRENKEAYINLTSRMDEMLKMLTEVRLELSNKRDRDK